MNVPDDEEMAEFLDQINSEENFKNSYPTDPELSPNEAKIGELKNLIIQKLPDIFPTMEALDQDFTMLEHPDGLNCEYDSYKIVAKDSRYQKSHFYGFPKE